MFKQYFRQEQTRSKFDFVKWDRIVRLKFHVLKYEVITNIQMFKLTILIRFVLLKWKSKIQNEQSDTRIARKAVYESLYVSKSS